jgi:hypothetical protein
VKAEIPQAAVEAAKHALRFGFELYDRNGVRINFTESILAWIILQAAYPHLIESFKSALLSDEAIKAIQASLSAGGFILDGSPSYDAKEKREAQALIRTAISAALGEGGNDG